MIFKFLSHKFCACFLAVVLLIGLLIGNPVPSWATATSRVCCQPDQYASDLTAIGAFSGMVLAEKLEINAHKTQNILLSTSKNFKPCVSLETQGKAILLSPLW